VNWRSHVNRRLSSGIAAIVAIARITLKSGDIWQCRQTRTTRPERCDVSLLRWAWKSGLAPTADNAQRNIYRVQKLYGLSPPSNPQLNVCYIPLLVKAAHEVAERWFVVDNSTASFLDTTAGAGRRLLCSSDTKATTGHADLVLGHVSVVDSSWATSAGLAHGDGFSTGAVWKFACHRSLATLDVRLQRQCKMPCGRGFFLPRVPRFAGLRYPGLPSDPHIRSHLAR